MGNQVVPLGIFGSQKNLNQNQLKEKDPHRNSIEDCPSITKILEVKSTQKYNNNNNNHNNSNNQYQNQLLKVSQVKERREKYKMRTNSPSTSSANCIDFGICDFLESKPPIKYYSSTDDSIETSSITINSRLNDKNINNNKKIKKKFPFQRNISLPAFAMINNSNQNQYQYQNQMNKQNKSQFSPLNFLERSRQNSISKSTSNVYAIPIEYNYSNSNCNSFSEELEVEAEEEERDSPECNSINNWNISFKNSNESILNLSLNGEDSPPFISEIEKKSILLRQMRVKLKRQDTNHVNYAGPEFRINNE